MAIDATPALGLMPGFPYEVWEAVALAVRPPFADSYLARAAVNEKVIRPHTLIAYDRLHAEPYAISAIEREGYTLAKPLYFGHPSRAGDGEGDQLHTRNPRLAPQSE